MLVLLPEILGLSQRGRLSTIESGSKTLEAVEAVGGGRHAKEGSGGRCRPVDVR